MNIERARGCLMGQLAGDALGSLVEFRTPEEIRRRYPDGVRELADGGTWNTLAGQPTDDSEMALLLARMLIERGGYDAGAALDAYRLWLATEPFDCGATIHAGLSGRPNPDSQANGAMMRASPLGIFAARHSPEQAAEWARRDAALTHPHPVCLQANALFVTAIAHAIAEECDGPELHQKICGWARNTADIHPALLETTLASAEAPPADYITHQGWVLVAFGNALWQLAHAASLEEAVVDTVMRGGDTDTNAAICGALLGAVRGLSAIPAQWRDSVLNCRPERGRPGVRHPRPRCLWPVDALELADALAGGPCPGDGTSCASPT